VRVPLAAMLISVAACAAPQRRSRVAIHCEPPEAEVTVDGMPYGAAADYTGANRILLAPGRHVLELRAHGLVETRRLEVGPEDDITVNVALGAAQGAAR
jgi:hypothetical protein